MLRTNNVLQRILVPTDGSKAASKRLKDEGFDAKGYKLDGRASRAIVSFAIEEKVDAIVMGTRGLGGLPHLMLGSTAEGVLRMATVPVFVVHGESEIKSTAGAPTILVAVDDSEPGDAAAALATELAASAKGRLILENVVDVESLYEYAAQYGTYISDVHAEWEAEGNRVVRVAAERAVAGGVMDVAENVVFGDPVEKIIECSRTGQADFIAIGTHGRRGLRRLTMGSVAEKVVRKSRIPVVVVRSYANLKSGKGADESILAMPKALA
jgi:nucleotide-binding universal stress UspA family protein